MHAKRSLLATAPAGHTLHDPLKSDATLPEGQSVQTPPALVACPALQPEHSRPCTPKPGAHDITRIALFPESLAKTVPEEGSTPMPFGSLNIANVPTPSSEP